jgi:NADH:ubiquinone oxidoreductase subunit 5 (subunit L)/multisubunit Na+/H+ antiporter MnhA subunit
VSEYRSGPQNASFLQGLILAGLIVFAGFLLNEQGLIGLLLAGDRSGISYLIAGIWLVLTLRWLWLLRWVQRQYDLPTDFDAQHREAILARWLNHGWFAADAVLKLGLLGTIIGFILMLAPISKLSGYDAASLQAALGEMSAGMAVALYTTLTGLVANLLLRLQFQILSDAMQEYLLELGRDPS